MATTSPIIIPIETPGLDQIKKLERQMKALERRVESLTPDLVKNATATKASGKAAATASGNIQRFGIALRSTVAPLVAAVGLSTALSRSLATLAERETDALILSRSLQNIGQGTETLRELQELSNQLDLGTLFNSEDFNKGFALLTSFKAIGVESYERVTKAAADLATVTRTDLSSAQLQLAKALENPVEGMSALSRSGTTFTKSQKEFVKSLVGSNQALEAQNYILSIVEGQYRGAAQAAAGGYAGAVDTLSKRMRDLNEQIGEIIQPASTAFLNGLAGALQFVTDDLVKTAKALRILSGWIQSAIGKVSELGNQFKIAAGSVYQYFQRLSDLIGLRSQFDAFGQTVSNNLDGITDAALRGIPIIGQYITLLQLADKLRGAINSSDLPGTDVDSNPLQGADLDMNAIRDQQRWADMMKQFQLDAGKITKAGGSSGGGKGGVDAAVLAAEREAERVADTLRDREQLVERLQAQIAIQEAGTDLQAEAKQFELDILEINQQYDNLLLDETNEMIRQNTERARALELDLARSKAIEGMMNPAQMEFTAFFKAQPEAQLLNDELTKTEELLKGSYEIVANNLTSGIEGLIDGTKEWGDVLSDVLGQLGSMFIQAGFSAMGAGLKIPGFAEGGRPPVGEVSIVGEKGPELFVPDSAGTVIPNNQMHAAMQRYSPANQSGLRGGGAAGDSAGGGGVSSFNYSPQITAMDMGGQQWVTVDQMNETVTAGMASAAKQGAKQGEARTLSRLQNSRSQRAKLGMS